MGSLLSSIVISGLFVLLLSASTHAQWEVVEVVPQPGKPAASDAIFPGKFENTTHKEAAWYLAGKKNDDRIVIVNLSTGDIRWKSMIFHRISKTSIAVVDVDGNGIDEILFSAQVDAETEPSLFVIKHKEGVFTQGPQSGAGTSAGLSGSKPVESPRKTESAPAVKNQPSPKSGAVADPPPVAPPEPTIPENAKATIKYQVAQKGSIRVDIFNGQGDLVRTLVNVEAEPGEFSVEWDGTGDGGNRLHNGKYFYKITTGKATLERGPITFH